MCVGFWRTHSRPSRLSALGWHLKIRLRRQRQLSGTYLALVGVSAYACVCVWFARISVRFTHDLAGGQVANGSHDNNNDSGGIFGDIGGIVGNVDDGVKKV